MSASEIAREVERIFASGLDPIDMVDQLVALERRLGPAGRAALTAAVCGSSPAWLAWTIWVGGSAAVGLGLGLLARKYVRPVVFGSPHGARFARGAFGRMFCK